MKINVAHIHEQGIDFAVFGADAPSGNDADRASLLTSLTLRARGAGMRVQKTALAFDCFGRTEFYGTPDLVRFLVSVLNNGGGIPWTHILDV